LPLGGAEVRGLWAKWRTGQAELVEIWQASAEGDHARIVRPLVLTGQRRLEIGDLAWPEIDPDKRI
jgi:integrase